MELIINQTRCVQCGLCAEECPTLSISFQPGSYPTANPAGASACMSCEHCLMICPTGALSIAGREPDQAPVIPQANLCTYDSLKAAIISRRSHRRYVQENVDKQTIAELLDAMKYVPTGVNCRQMLFTVIDDITVMDQLRKKVYQKIAQQIAADPENAFFQHINRVITAGRDPIFRTAPHLIVVTNPETAPCSATDPVIALSYFELLAQARGLGTVWFGYMPRLINTFMPELREMVGIPHDHTFGYAMLFGKTLCQFQRGPQPSPVTVKTLDHIEDVPSVQ